MSRLVAGLAVAAAMLGAPALASAQCSDTTLADVEDEVMCPVCGTPLALATEAPQAKRERELIRRLIDDCRSKDEVKAALVAEFGDDVLALPGDDGFDLAAYVVPALALILAAGGIAFATLRWRRMRTSAESPGGGRSAPADSDRLDADLERYDL